MPTNDSVNSKDVPEPPQCDGKLGQPERPVQEADAGQRFYEQYKDWVDLMNEHVREHGVFGEEWRRW